MKKMSKRVSSIILASLVLTLGVSGGHAKSDKDDKKKEQKTLTVSTFDEELYRKDIFKPFEKKYNVKIVCEFGNNFERLNKLKSGDSKSDVALFTDYYAMQGVEEGLFEKVNRKNIPNINNLYSMAKTPLGKDYGPAYAVSSFGMIYNGDKIKEPIVSWGDLWKPEFKNRVTMPHITTSAGPIMLFIAAEQANVDIKKNEDKVFEKMKELSENVIKFDKDATETINMFTMGEVDILGGYSFERETITENVPATKWVDPKEGSYAIIDTVNIVKGTKNKELAEKFIDWILSEEVQKNQALNKLDSPTNKKVKLTPEEAEGLIYGKKAIESLNTLDWKYVNKSLERWIERWNKEIGTTK
ncbi:spermidine/putrescine-binding periplasmic protein [Gottschalkia purinilytica]|uniref:Spermidine/putrescine-binding periplasmic protein n=1 Tax=Gottschalkia purinilytica TaxID=1503 RepID=A0A0L0W8T8_GOTPU|nr:ABC transporter substrate-binding protein [Gottschalkia purinilytica]KNF07872.1 spermidine/putrescine-binding periplasmic protein [Gottschalkia purinilytica]